MVFGRNDDLIWFLNNFPKNRHSWLVFVKICILGLHRSLENGWWCVGPLFEKGRGHHHPFLGHVGLEVILTWMTNSPHLTIQNAPKSRVQLLPGAGGGHIFSVSASTALEANFSNLCNSSLIDSKLKFYYTNKYLGVQKKHQNWNQASNEKKVLVKLFLFFITCADGKSAALCRRADCIFGKQFFAISLKQSLLTTLRCMFWPSFSVKFKKLKELFRF